MKKLPLKLEKRLQKRKDENSFRQLSSETFGVDLFSNDYLGFARSEKIFENTVRILDASKLLNGSTGSRLLSGNHPLFKKAENMLASFHNSQSALIFNSGYDANVGFFSAVPQKNDIIFYDEFSHASIRDGLKMSLARNVKFGHNDLEGLRKKLQKFSKEEDSEIYVVTESVFSMDGDSPDLEALVGMADEFNFNLIVDEAHATGVLGKKGEGLLQELGLEREIFARIHTFGKAMGCHGAVILGSRQLMDYLINFSRSFIYTTALSPHSIASIFATYRFLENDRSELNILRENIQYFRSEIKKNALEDSFVESESAIQSCIIPGNSEVKEIAAGLHGKGFNVKAILSPTVPQGKERLRFCIHSYNSTQEISEVLKLLANFVAKS
ncbi:pyridoxal phosphate-dependent aminotransferase family protein [Gramella jeungdoensis]|uniref:Pyridoxal phosphate-dependent aminotransferase family protein n=1 Tax=Gramella jeungdoensis TaxID=708091 RepID=A0ABT0Z5E5_9FLAO|nr:pyridoxal phosphate-dependent aminotransferase family protein [Gramella jeungdoensis]MCM8570941.1 pyridoxal phosphate-dependent aminotransferase family protein [Gramella jeungdoensis]